MTRKDRAPRQDLKQAARRAWDQDLTSWRLALAADRLAHHTVRSYLYGTGKLADWASERGKAPDDITQQDLRRWLVTLQAGLSAGSQAAVWAAVRRFFVFRASELDAPNVARGVRGPRPGEGTTPVLTDDQIRALLALCKGRDFLAARDRALILTLLDTGVRSGELLSMRVSELDLARRVAVVTGKGRAGRGPRTRVVPFGHTTARAIDRYLRVRAEINRDGLDALWLAETGAAYVDTSLRTRLTELGRRAGIDHLHPHQFRHTFAHRFRAQGGSADDLLRLGGWRSHAMLARYGASAADERALNAYQSVADRL